MKTRPDSIRSACRVLFLIVLASTPAFAYVDPPGRVARLAYVQGDVSFQPGGEDDWVWASINRPLTTGDGLWTDYESRAELQLGAAAIRIDEQSDVSFLAIDDETVQIQLNAGALNIRVQHLYRNEVVEIDTPNVAITLLRPGTYRIDADPYGEFTSVSVRQGQIQIDGGGQAYYVDAGSEVQAYGTYEVEYSFYELSPLDDFDQWARERDRRADLSPRYVSREVIGYQDLDTYGTWRVDDRLGPVWIPSRVSREWAPFRDGHWVWIDPWGWTWVDDQPWGFATSHYGRWAYLPSRATWGWVPPQQGRPNRPSDRSVFAVSYTERPFYSPANVTFLGASIHFNAGGVAWFPLGPGEVYVPAYQASRTYIDQLNITNTNVQSTYVNTVLNSRQQITYVNQRVAGAVVAVPKTVFVSAKPVASAVARVSVDEANRASAVRVAPIAPERASVLGRTVRKAQDRAAGAVTASAAAAPQPPAVVKTRKVVVRKTPPPSRVPFERKQQAMAADPGKPLDQQTEQQLRAGAPPPAVVKVAPAAPVKPAEKGEKEPRPAAEKRAARRLLQQPSGQAGAAPATPPAAEQSAEQGAEKAHAEQAAKLAAERTRAQQADKARREQADQEQAEKIRQREAALQDAEQARTDQAEKQEAERTLARQDEKDRRDQAAKQEEEKTAARQAQGKARQEQSAQQESEKNRERQARQEAEKARREPAAAQQPAPNPQEEAAQPPRSPGARGNRPASPSPGGDAPLRVAEDVQAEKLIPQAPPNKPAAQKKAGAQGSVRLRALIGADGTVMNVTVISGPKALRAAALEKARQYVYHPTLVDGKPVEVETEISIQL